MMIFFAALLLLLLKVGGKIFIAIIHFRSSQQIYFPVNVFNKKGVTPEFLFPPYTVKGKGGQRYYYFYECVDALDRYSGRSCR